MLGVQDSLLTHSTSLEIFLRYVRMETLVTL